MIKLIEIIIIIIITHFLKHVKVKCSNFSNKVEFLKNEEY